MRSTAFCCIPLSLIIILKVVGSVKKVELRK